MQKSHRHRLKAVFELFGESTRVIVILLKCSSKYDRCSIRAWNFCLFTLRPLFGQCDAQFSLHNQTWTLNEFLSCLNESRDGHHSTKIVCVCFVILSSFFCCYNVIWAHRPSHIGQYTTRFSKENARELRKKSSYTLVCANDDD